MKISQAKRCQGANGVPKGLDEILIRQQSQTSLLLVWAEADCRSVCTNGGRDGVGDAKKKLDAFRDVAAVWIGGRAIINMRPEELVDQKP